MNNYKKCWDFIRANRNYFYTVILLFFAFIILGLFYQPESITNYLNELLKNLFEQAKNNNYFEMLVFIFKNNITTAFIALVFGLFFGVYPIFVVAMNGYVVGYVISLSYKAAGASSILLLLPHGIFEIPALFLSLGLGIKLGFSLVSGLVSGKLKKFVFSLENSLRIFIYLILPLLIIAAIIETSLIFLI